MQIDDFLATNVEGYLFHDLDSMKTLRPASINRCGAAGYPMVMTVVAGIELLGGLVGTDAVPFDPLKGNAYFQHYWNHYLVAANPSYAQNNRLWAIVRQLVRHKLAHTYLTAPGIRVEKCEPPRHLQWDADAAELTIDCVQFSDDFQTSYRATIPRLLRGESPPERGFPATRATMQLRLDGMIAQYREEAKKQLTMLTTSPQTMLAQDGTPATITAYTSSTGGMTGWPPVGQRGV